MTLTAAPRRPTPVRPTILVVERVGSVIDEGERVRLERLARRLLADEPALLDTDAFGAVSPGVTDAPALVLEDRHEISLVGDSDERGLEQRALQLAGDGDLVALSGPRDLGFEAYCRDTLGLGAVRALSVPARRGRPASLARRCSEHAPTLARAVATARAAGGLNVVPYIGTGSVWQLAGLIADSAGVATRVASPPPRLTRRVNDKLWFTERVREVLGEHAAPGSCAVFSPAAAAGRVAHLARRCPRVVVKVPDSAGGKGNVVLDSAPLRRLDPDSLRALLADLVAGLGWQRTYPLLVGIWDQPLLDSPSVQLWVPEPDQGPPVVTGIFSQVLHGARSAFTGAQPSELPAAWQDRLAQDAARLALLFQHLGYYGPCSLDAIIAGPDLDRARLHWVDANGRWGAVTLAINLANRLLGPRPPTIVVTHRASMRFPPRPLAAVLDTLGPQLFHPDAGPRGVVLVAPRPMTTGTGVSLVAFGPDAPAAQAAATTAITSLGASATTSS